MPILTSGSNVTLTVSAGQILTVQSDQAIFDFENPVGTRLGEYGADTVFGPFAASGSVKLSSVQGPVYYELASKPVGQSVPFDPSNVVIGGGSISSLLGSRRRIASQHGGWLVQNASRSNGTTQTGGTDRLQWVPNTDITGVEFVFVNAYVDTTADMNPTGNVLPFYAALESVANKLYPISFNSNSGSPISTGGKTSVNLGDGCLMHSLPVRGGLFPAGQNRWYRVYKAVSAGQKWPLIHASDNVAWAGLQTTDAVYGSSVTDQSDQTATFGAVAWGNYAATAYSFGAVAIIAEQLTPVPVVMITGDSIGAGTADINGRGYIGRALGNAGVAYHNDSVAGTIVSNLADRAVVPQYLSRFVDHVILHGLTNDLNGGSITTLAQAQTTFLNFCKAFGCRTNRLWICTILPRTTSTDSWSTTGGQTPASWESLRVQINNWLRDGSASGAIATLNSQLSISSVLGVIDACPAIEVNSDGSALTLGANQQQANGAGGRWITNGVGNTYTSDGIHPKSIATALMAPYVPTAKFTIV